MPERYFKYIGFCLFYKNVKLATAVQPIMFKALYRY